MRCCFVHSQNENYYYVGVFCLFVCFVFVFVLFFVFWGRGVFGFVLLGFLLLFCFVLFFVHQENENYCVMFCTSRE